MIRLASRPTRLVQQLDRIVRRHLSPRLLPIKLAGAPVLVGKITLPSSILQFWDLGGQRGIRSIWHRYYDDCHAVAYVIDADDRERLSEGWEVFGLCLLSDFS